MRWNRRWLTAAFLSLCSAEAPRPAVADSYLRLQDGPSAPLVTRFIGGAGVCVAELEGGALHRLVNGRWIALSAKTWDGGAPPRGELVFAAGGEVFGLVSRPPSYGMWLVRLTPDGWQRLASVPLLDSGRSLQGAFAHDERSLWVVSPAPCNDARGSLYRYDLSTGARVEEPKPPTSGSIFVVGGSLVLLSWFKGWSCNLSPETSATSQTGQDEAIAYRLEDTAEGRVYRPIAVPWTASIKSTDSALWLFYEQGVRRFDGLAVSDPIDLGGREIGEITEVNGTTVMSQLYPGDGLERGTLLTPVDGHLEPFTPPHPSPVGVRPFRCDAALATLSDDLMPRLLSDGGWKEARGLPEFEGAATWLQGTDGVRWAVRGSGIWRRDAPGAWTLLPTPRLPYWSLEMFLHRDQPVVWCVLGDGKTTLRMWDPRVLSWITLALPDDVRSAASHEGMLYVWTYASDGSNAVFRLAGPGRERLPIEGSAPYVGMFRSVGPDLYLASGEALFRLQGDRFVRILKDVLRERVVHEVLGFEGDLVLGVGVPDSVRASSLLYLRGDDVLLERSLLYEASGPLGRAGDLVTVGHYVLRPDGEVREFRSDWVFTSVDRDGKLAWAANTLAPLHEVVERPARLNLPVSVDATAPNGFRYRTELLLGNFGLSPVVARVLAGTSREPALTVTIAAGTEVRLRDPLPGFVGPLAVEFAAPSALTGSLRDAERAGASDTDQVYAAVEVFTTTDKGRVGVMLEGRPSGHFLGEALITPPLSHPGARTTVVISSAADGGLETIELPPPSDYQDAPAFLQPGALWIREVDPDSFKKPFRVWSPAFPDGWRVVDLMTYAVQNLAGGDALAVQPPRRARNQRRFVIPVVRSRTYAAPFSRTELHLPDSGGPYRARYRSAVRYEPKIDVTLSLPLRPWPETMIRIPDLEAFLRSSGVPLGAGGMDGTLEIEGQVLSGTASLFTVDSAGPVVGTSIPVISEAEGATRRGVVPGLRRDAGTRTDLHLLNLEPGGGQGVGLSLEIRRADGSLVENLLNIPLEPGRRWTLEDFLRRDRVVDGDAYVVVRSWGTARFTAIAEVVRTGTSDSTFFQMIPTD